MAMDDISNALDHGVMPDEVDSPVKFRFPLLLRRAWYGLNQAFRRHTLSPVVLLVPAASTADKCTGVRR